MPIRSQEARYSDPEITFQSSLELKYSNIYLFRYQLLTPFQQALELNSNSTQFTEIRQTKLWKVKIIAVSAKNDSKVLVLGPKKTRKAKTTERIGQDKTMVYFKENMFMEFQMPVKPIQHFSRAKSEKQFIRS